MRVVLLRCDYDGVLVVDYPDCAVGVEVLGVNIMEAKRQAWADRPRLQTISQRVAELEKINAALVKALESARWEIARGGHPGRWATVEVITDALALAKGEK